MLGLKLNHVSERGYWCRSNVNVYRQSSIRSSELQFFLTVGTKRKAPCIIGIEMVSKSCNHISISDNTLDCNEVIPDPRHRLMCFLCHESIKITHLCDNTELVIVHSNDDNFVWYALSATDMRPFPILSEIIFEFWILWKFSLDLSMICIIQSGNKFAR